MKNENLKNLIKDIKKTALTAEEKSGLFARLDAYADSHQAKKIESPYFSYFHFSKTFTYVFASIALVIIIGGGTVSASGKALPGDFLYPVKVHISEPIQSVLATTPEAKQLVQVAHIEERLNEAEILAVQGRLATTTAVEIQQNVEDHIRSFDTKLSKKNNDDLEIKMSAHSIVLKKIRDNSKDDQKSNIEKIENTTVAREKVEDNKPQVMSARVMSVSAPQAKEVKSEVKVIEGKDAEREIKVRKEVEDIDRKIEKRRRRD